jgi:hypothetical protein
MDLFDVFFFVRVPNLIRTKNLSASTSRSETRATSLFGQFPGDLDSPELIPGWL